MAVAVLGTFAVGLCIGNAELPVPSLTHQSGQFLVAHLITLVPAVFFLYGKGRGGSQTEDVASRFLRGWDVALAAAIVAASVTMMALSEALRPSGLALVLGRNVAGYIGLALLLNVVVGCRLAGALLTLVPLVCAAAGWGPGNRPLPWAWPLHAADSSIAAGLAASAVLAGVVGALVRQKPLFDVQLRA
ncbi:hypothetical protein [Streptomyces sp.]